MIMRFLVIASLFVLASRAKEKTCKTFPGDADWPSEREWDHFNTTVGGRLIKTVPLGSPCHDPNYDAELCEELKSEWLFPPVQ